MASTSDNVELLLLSQVNELNSITGYTDCEVLIFFLLRMFHSIDQLFCTEYVNVQMMSTISEVSVQNLSQVSNLFRFTVTQSFRVDALCIGNTVKSPVIRQLGNRVQRSNQTILFCTIRGAAPGANGVNALRPSGVAPVASP